MKTTKLWQASKQRISDSHITRFRKQMFPAAENYSQLWQASVDDFPTFWSKLWDWAEIIGTKGERDFQPSTGDNPMIGASFFPDAKLNYAENLLEVGKDEDLAIIYQIEDKPPRYLTRKQLREKVYALATYLQSIGIKKGDRVAGWLPNMDASIIGALATSAIGGVWTSASPDFGVDALYDRFCQTKPRVLLTTNSYLHKGREFSIVDKWQALQKTLPSIEEIIICDNLQEYHLNQETSQETSVKISLLREVFAAYPGLSSFDYLRLPFAAPLFVLYSSGTTGKPKSIVHSAGGTLLEHRKEHLLHCDIKPNEKVLYATTCGWMMWNWLLTALASRACLVLYEGNPMYPTVGHLWNFIDKEKISFFGTSASYLKAIEKANFSSAAEKLGLDSLKTIASTGSVLNDYQFDYVYNNIKKDLHLASISGGTDIISCFVMGSVDQSVNRGEIQVAGLGLEVRVYDGSSDEARECASGEFGELVCVKPFPCQPLGFWEDEDGAKYRKAYFSRYENIWHHGDLIAHLGKEPGLSYVIRGRSDNTLNAQGVRIGTAEIYSQVESIAHIAAAVAVDQEAGETSPHNDTRIVLFVQMEENYQLSDEIKGEIKRRLKTNCSPRHVPAVIAQVAEIPMTRTGKISESAVKDVVNKREVKNLGSLANPLALKLFRNRPELD